MQLLKIGGHEMDDAAFLAGLGTAVAAIAEPLIIVHGGGQAIAALQQRLGLTPVKVDGLRVTDAESLAVTQMVLSGHINKLLVTTLLAAGVRAVGLSGVDGGWLRCEKKPHPRVDLGFVGQIVAVEPALIQGLLAQGLTPVISPISLGRDGQIYNVNADEAAAAVARALGATQLTFVSNVPGVLDAAGRLIPQLTPAETAVLLQTGVIHGGMVPKVQAALAALNPPPANGGPSAGAAPARGVPAARIVNLAGLANGGGTRFAAGQP